MVSVHEQEFIRGFFFRILFKPRFCNQLELLQQQVNPIQKAAIHISERAKELCDIQSRAPDSIAGAAIYMACAAAGERKSMKGKYLFLIDDR